MKILVTGATGYIGLHTCVELITHNHHIVMVDDFSRSHRNTKKRITALLGYLPTCYELNLCDEPALNEIFRIEGPLDGVIHCAGFKAVAESVQFPERYYHNNLVGTCQLLQVMHSHGVQRLIFGSSATVYGTTTSMPLQEDMPCQPTNPYGWSKLFIERMIQDMQAAHPTFQAAILRYFNPLGAHNSGLIGEYPDLSAQNLMPNLMLVILNKKPVLDIFGHNYDTPDGTCIRDYIHVMDVARAQVSALQVLTVPHQKTVCVNLGAGRGHSVLEVLHTLERVSGCSIPYRYRARRPGDISCCYASAELAYEKLAGWHTAYTLEEMCQDTWRWIQHLQQEQKTDATKNTQKSLPPHKG